MKKVVWDIGHKDSDSGAVGQGFREVDLNYSISKYGIAELERHGLSVKVTTGSLRERSNVSNNWKADSLISVHINAGGGDGFGSYIYAKGGEAEKIANSINKQVIETDKLNNAHGNPLKVANFHMLRETKMPAVLVEVAFIDTVDITCIDEEHERKAMGISIAHGILNYYGIKIKENTQEAGKGWRVCIGYYEDVNNAKRLEKEAKEKGFKDAYIVQYSK